MPDLEKRVDHDGGEMPKEKKYQLKVCLSPSCLFEHMK